ncbi:hypothetical protein MNV49_001206 [Pseudohyphozyma bogoriensis]|nr:hypothetical protein MNV49_001206 [Pseudohyphozyma bogoriensis]
MLRLHLLATLTAVVSLAAVNAQTSSSGNSSNPAEDDGFGDWVASLPPSCNSTCSPFADIVVNCNRFSNDTEAEECGCASATYSSFTNCANCVLGAVNTSSDVGQQIEALTIGLSAECNVSLSLAGADAETNSLLSSVGESATTTYLSSAGTSTSSSSSTSPSVTSSSSSSTSQTSGPTSAPTTATGTTSPAPATTSQPGGAAQNGVPLATGAILMACGLLLL